ncbi:MAG TPA: RNA polymerase sigma factor [Spirochaetota bacterium]|nr:RNA polymerase sigma factor [Spirochaetota bacterium]HPC40288.1 RNA polymerase sigma factor [Spirochaetota bacterium]HPL15331.1 RNA polymerase sigma factor [Spirochaetota bacterium]HQF07237.1 RNA polymerase sigma factor [Spirochaetota bacterium]HQH96138.1 RNA polymerase sigma factor [Spirochaetota bacterium]
MLSKDQISDIYRQFSPEIYRYLYKLTHSTDTSEDLLQEVFEKFIGYTAEKEIQEDKYRAFLYKTAHNLSVNYLIKQNRDHPGCLHEMEESLKTEDTYLDRLMLDDLNRAIYRILETLDPESRSIFIMHKEDGMHYDEIADTLSLSARTVRRRIKNVLDILYTELKKDGFLT